MEEKGAGRLDMMQLASKRIGGPVLGLGEDANESVEIGGLRKKLEPAHGAIEDVVNVAADSISQMSWHGDTLIPEAALDKKKTVR